MVPRRVLAVLFLYVFVVVVSASTDNATENKLVRICVLPEQMKLCQQMARDVPDTWECSQSRDKLECAQRLAHGDIEIANMDSRSIYISGKYYGGVPLATEIIDGQPHKYEGVALVKSNSDIRSLEDLRGRRSCHTGVGRTVGWQLPVASLMAKGVMQPDCDEGELKAVETFFSGGSCAPGNWSSDPIVDAALKERYKGLCSRCADPSTCSAEDSYAGYKGSVRCLLDNSGDIAFTKIPVLMDLIQKDPSISQNLDLLCLDGSRHPLATTEQKDMCVWGFRPSNAFMTSQYVLDGGRDRLVTALERTRSLSVAPQRRHLEWYHKVFLSSDKVNSYQLVGPERSDYRSYLGDFINAIEKSRAGCSTPPPRASICVVSDQELAKCKDYSKAAESRGMTLGIDCVVATSKVACMETLKMGHCNLLVLDGGDVYKGGRYYGLQPVAAEIYGETDASYFAVAVIRSASDARKLSDLKGLRSCHTGIGKTAGWVVPIGALIYDGSIDRSECNKAESIARFFSAGSCVPGANDTKYNPGRAQAEKLCRQCIGGDRPETKCERDNREKYNGYSGALRCLAEGRGDVAFVKHTTVPENTDGNGGKKGEGPTWQRDLLSSDFQLLCLQGGTAPVEQFKDCNLAKVPSHYVMTNGDASPLLRLQLARLMADTSKFFDNDSELFKVFANYFGDLADVLFKSSTTALKSAPMTANYADVLGERFYEASQAVDPKLCQTAK